ncbi:uncharacterized protein BJX67DRAFT_373262 [Aspergillus lucknowensis]|uniref:Uncharacterized protein n=1 Tax=Aspergillus lucknowensis TaxID=176173 RepID=A0ABR4LLS3_9EURO
MLRILTPDIIANAARTQIQTGERACLNWGMEDLNPPGFGRKPFEHSVNWVVKGVAFDDEYHFNPQQSSHRRPKTPHRRLFYGGTTAEEIQDPSNPRIGIGHWARKGIAGRRVLIDYSETSLDTVLEIAREAKIEFHHGDIFSLRVSLRETWASMGNREKQAYSAQQMPKHAGIEQSERVLRFFWDNHFAAVAPDAVSFEVFPPLNPEFNLHHHLLAGWGTDRGNVDLDELSEMCKAHGRWTFFVSSSPLNWKRGVIENARAALSALVSWRTLALLLAILNLKNLPFVWHIRVFRQLFINLRFRPNAPFFPKGKALTTSSGKPTHPVFVPMTITSRTPLLETDYNLHKSNSTYFTDLDVSRTALVTRIYSPGVGLLSKELDAELAAAARKEGKPIPARKSIYVALGSVFCNFKREIKPYALFEVESRVLGWDQKWMYIISFFLAPQSREDKSGKRVLYASAISKYVVKKGRLTIAPERALRKSGFLPERPEGDAAGAGAGTTAAEVESADASGTGTPSGITATASGVDGSFVREVLKLQDGQIPETGKLEAERRANEASWDGGEWNWERIEEERARGMKMLEGFCDLDSKLFEEWER